MYYNLHTFINLVNFGGNLVQKIRIIGGRQLKGEVSISGAKNAVLKLMAAAILPKGETVIHNVPELTDVNIMLHVIEGLGVKTN